MSTPELRAAADAFLTSMQAAHFNKYRGRRETPVRPIEEYAPGDQQALLSGLQAAINAYIKVRANQSTLTD